MPTPPSNDALFGSLTNSVWSGECIVVLGAGVSSPDYPLWSGLCAQMVDKLGLREDEFDIDDPLNMAEVAKIKYPDKYFKFLDEVFESKPHLTCARRYHMLARIPFSSYLTLNFDPALYEILELHRNVNVSQYPTLTNQHHRIQEIFYVHGRLGPGRDARTTKLVLSSSDFKTAYHPYKSRLHSFWQDIFLNNNVVFIGCDPKEPHLRKILSSCKRLREEEFGLELPGKPRWYLLWHDKLSGRPASLVRNAGILPVLYSRKDEHFSGLGKILEYWAQVEKPRFRNGDIAVDFKSESEPER